MITTLTGPNSFMVRDELARRVSEFTRQNSDMGLERLDGEEADFGRITGAIQSLPFLAPKKLVVLKSPGILKQFAENLEELIDTVPETNDVIIIEPKPDKRSGYYKKLKKLTDFKEFNNLDVNGLVKWLSGAAKERDGQLAPADARFLVERVGEDQLRLSNELDKLLTYEPKVTRANIELLTDQAPQGTVFQLLDAAFAGNKAKAVDLYTSQRAQRVEPLAILAMLAWQLHILAVVKTAGDRSPAQIAKEAGISPFVVQKTAAIAKRISLAEVKRLVGDLHRLDVRLKSSNIDADEALQHYLLNIA